MREDTDVTEYVTIVADSLDEIQQESRARKLSENNFSILHRVGHHQVHLISRDGATGGASTGSKVVATFFRNNSIR